MRTRISGVRDKLHLQARRARGFDQRDLTQRAGGY